jgi:iron uptake system component EfeO
MKRVHAMVLGLGGLCLAGTALADDKVSPLELVQPIADYKAYVSVEVDELAVETAKFAAAVKAGDLAAAQALYAPTRVHYERVEPIAELFSDLDGSVDSRADDHEKKELDPGFTGFHRIEYGLFDRQSTDGLQPLADKLVADVAELKRRVAGLAVPPDKMVGGAAALIEEVAATKISGEEDRYSGTDLWDFQANVDGAQKIFNLLRPLITPRNPELDARVQANFTKVDGLLARYREKDGQFQNYDKLSPSDRNALKGSITALAEDLSLLRGTLALD